MEGSGASLFAKRDDHGCGCRRIGKNLARGNTHDVYSICLQECIALQIQIRTIPHVVRDAIDLETEFCLRAVEIDHEWADRVLPAEFESGTTRTQFSP